MVRKKRFMSVTSTGGTASSVPDAQTEENVENRREKWLTAEQRIVVLAPPRGDQGAARFHPDQGIAVGKKFRPT